MRNSMTNKPWTLRCASCNCRKWRILTELECFQLFEIKQQIFTKLWGKTVSNHIEVMIPSSGSRSYRTSHNHFDETHACVQTATRQVGWYLTWLRRQLLPHLVRACKEALDIVDQHKLSAKLRRCSVTQPPIESLGGKIDAKRLHDEKQRIAAIQCWPELKSWQHNKQKKVSKTCQGFGSVLHTWGAMDNLCKSKELPVVGRLGSFALF